jgi:hypothetical protein
MLKASIDHVASWLSPAAKIVADNPQLNPGRARSPSQLAP